ncbi:MAG: hypothetical protein WBW01_07255, partial [Terriglobales bacterium]
MLILIVIVLASSDHAPWWQVQTSGIDTNLRGVSVSDEPDGKYEYVVWASGSNGVVLRSTNEGSTWQQLHVPGGGNLDFRDIKAFDEDTAYVM